MSAAVASADNSPAQADRRVRYRLLERLRAELDAVVHSIWEQMSAMVPYAEMGATAAGEVRVTICWVFATVLDCVRDERQLASIELERLRLVGATRARDGIPLEAMLRALQVGLATGLQRLATTAAANQDPSAMEHVADIIPTLMTLSIEVADALRDGYRAEARPEWQAATEARARSAFITGVLEAAVGEDQLTRQSRALGLAPVRMWALVVVLPCAKADDAVDLHAIVDALTQAVPSAIKGPVRSRPAHAVVVIHGSPDLDAPGHARRALERVASGHRVTLVTAEFTGLRDLGDRYRRFRPHADVASTVTDRPSIVPLDDLLGYEVLSYVPSEVAEWCIRDVLGPVLAEPPERAERWLKALQALQATGGNVTTAADRLHVHHQTVRQWLDRLSQQTGIDPRRPRDSRRIALALHLLRLHPSSLLARGDSP